MGWLRRDDSKEEKHPSGVSRHIGYLVVTSVLVSIALTILYLVVSNSIAKHKNNSVVTVLFFFSYLNVSLPIANPKIGNISVDNLLFLLLFFITNYLK